MQKHVKKFGNYLQLIALITTIVAKHDIDLLFRVDVCLLPEDISLCCCFKCIISYNEKTKLIIGYIKAFQYLKLFVDMHISTHKGEILVLCTMFCNYQYKS